jgi:hypothetical protein
MTESTKGPEDPMIRPKSLRQLAAYSISLPAFAVSPKLAKETVYMPSHVAAEMLGRPAARPSSSSTGEVPGVRSESAGS